MMRGSSLSLTQRRSPSWAASSSRKRERHISRMLATARGSLESPSASATGPRTLSPGLPGSPCEAPASPPTPAAVAATACAHSSIASSTAGASTCLGSRRSGDLRSTLRTAASAPTSKAARALASSPPTRRPMRMYCGEHSRSRQCSAERSNGRSRVSTSRIAFISWSLSPSLPRPPGLERLPAPPWSAHADRTKAGSSAMASAWSEMSSAWACAGMSSFPSFVDSDSPARRVAFPAQQRRLCCCARTHAVNSPTMKSWEGELSESVERSSSLMRGSITCKKSRRCRTQGVTCDSMPGSSSHASFFESSRTCFAARAASWAACPTPSFCDSDRAKGAASEPDVVIPSKEARGMLQASARLSTSRERATVLAGALMKSNATMLSLLNATHLSTDFLHAPYKRAEAGSLSLRRLRKTPCLRVLSSASASSNIPPARRRSGDELAPAAACAHRNSSGGSVSQNTSPQSAASTFALSIARRPATASSTAPSARLLAVPRSVIAAVSPGTLAMGCFKYQRIALPMPSSSAH
mmetsp:Transcript_12424/g.52232  ORF Transcript_12424/g.52232 Transcript_12424/m.52232 type:complete len:526 (-) Transcript_12424:4140-5717(-)